MKNLNKIIGLFLALSILTAILSGCGLFNKTPGGDNQGGGNEHTHFFATEWEKDENNHWHVCAGENCSEKADVEAHLWNEGVETTPATKDNEGVKTFSCTACGYEKTESIDKLETKNIDLYVIIGQSNATGISKPESVTNVKDAYINGFNNVYYYGTAEKVLTGGFKTPVKFGYGYKSERFGAEIGMANMISEYSEAAESLIFKYAYEGTNLTDNQTTNNSIKNGNWCPPSMRGEGAFELTGALYDGFIASLKDAVELYESNGYTVNLKGTFWMQGEAETYDGLYESANYKGHLEALIDDVRIDYTEILGAATAMAPFVIGKICPTYHYGSAGVQAVREIQEQVAQIKENVYTVETSDYVIYDYATETIVGTDKYHFNGDDMISLGEEVIEVIFENTIPDFDLKENKTHHFTVADNDPFLASKGGSFGTAVYVNHDTNGKYYEATQGITFTTTVTVSEATEASFIVKLARKAGRTEKISDVIRGLAVNGQSVKVSDESITSAGWEAANAINAVLATVSLKAGTNVITFTRGTNDNSWNFNVAGVAYIVDEDVELDLGYHTFNVESDDPFVASNGGSINRVNTTSEGSAIKDSSKYGIYYKLTVDTVFTMKVNASKATTAKITIRINSTNGKTYTYASLIDAITVNGASATLNEGSVTTAGWYVSNASDVAIATISLNEGNNTIVIDMGKTGVNISSIVFETDAEVVLLLGATK